ncbi:MAG TPA: hypothetical protein VL307_16730 [Chitinophagaceae bacterium]|jgi:hypothetical protein|nr:hypothetical protein [Chitinophagaceae bacterium]
MKKSFLFIALLATLAAGIASCEKSKDYIVDESTRSGGYLPVSTNALLDVNNNTTIGTSASSTKYAPGAVVKTELQFFSIDPIKEINLFETVGAGTKTKVGASIPYASAYSSIKKLDTLLVSYTVPTAASGTTIKLEYEIMNINTKSITRTASFKVQ